MTDSDESDFQFSEQAEKQESCKNEQAVNLLYSWMSDESCYDESVWDDLKKNIEENRLSERKRFKPEKRKVEDVFKDIRGHVTYYDDILKPETDEWDEA
ncbi:MAG: hypothetical protein GY795_32255 [Desulfobacterales bacterium]|nr:hypothetical protein [Desulfobacterales bacterium]